MMKIDIQIIVNKFGQDLISINEITNYFQQLDIEHKRSFLNDISFLILQTKVLDTDIDEAIFLYNLKSTYTPCVLIKKGIKNNVLQTIINLPVNELDKSFKLFIGLFKIGYQRNFNKNSDINKWWYLDLSDNNFVERIKQLSTIKIIIKKIYDNKGNETGVVLTALPPFRLNLYEKNLLEKQLELYAFNKLYTNQGLTICKQIYEDIASLTIIKNINNLDYQNDEINIY